jgi:preprotein translocase subunit SecA
MLKRRGTTHNVLNAKQHKRESEIVAEAGMPGAVTIATNMAGRGTDIKLGDSVTVPRTVGWAKAKGLDVVEIQPVDPTLYDEKAAERPDDHVIELGGLHIIGSERHESRRIDRQLRGRSGRQGDPGESQFFLSLEDDLMRLFGSDRIASAMEKMGAEEGEVITHGLVTRSIERAQKRVEMNNFESRKRLLDYDDVMNQQREVIYDMRLFALEGGEDLKGEIWEMVEYALRAAVEEFTHEEEAHEEWDLAGLRQRLLLDFFIVADQLPQQNDPNNAPDGEDVVYGVLASGRDAFHRKIEGFGEVSERVMSFVLLSTIDDKWKDHLHDLDHLKTSISFRSWGQKDPLVEYKQDAYEMFVGMIADLRKTVAQNFFRAQIGAPPQVRAQPRQRMVLSGPSETPDTAVGSGAIARREEAVGEAPARVDAMGMARKSRADVGGMGGPMKSPDPRDLATNRGEERDKTPVTVVDEPGRNDPCPCGSGKKYKKCHGSRG